MARVATTLLICFCWAADSAAQPSVRARLLASAQATRQLLNNSRSGSNDYDEWDKIDRKSEVMPRRHPLKTDVPKYARQRPWSHDYDVRFGDSLGLGLALSNRQAARWPTPDDGPALRALLADRDAAVRSLAVEALATLHDPEDLERIAALLTDHANGVPALGWERWMNSWRVPYDRSDYDLVRSWFARRVSSYARVALRLMTGRDFDAASFAAWHERNHGGRSDFWYWDVRLRQMLREADAESTDGDYYARLRATAATLRPELRDMPAEVEAKACLLSYQHYLGPCNDLRVTPARLLELLDRQNLWADVDWDAYRTRIGEPSYDTLVREIVRVSDKYFTARDVPRLSAVLAREHESLGTAKVPMLVAIANFLPPAGHDNIDAPDTREGSLRNAFRQETIKYPQGDLAKELLRIDAERHWPFLEPLFFTEPNAQSDLRAAILDELGAQPRTPEKRSILAAIVLDDRFKAIWTRPDKRGGDSRERDAAARAVNAHAGREVLSVTLLQELFLYGTTRSDAALARVQAIVRESLAAR
jgi:hypothetical protein